MCNMYVCMYVYTYMILISIFLLVWFVGINISFPFCLSSMFLWLFSQFSLYVYFIVSVNKAIIICTYMEVVNTCIFVGSSFC